VPTYEYVCSSCKSEFEVEQSMRDPAVDVCHRCGSETVKRLISKTSFSLVGEGWSSSGYAKSSVPSQ
jgi:putative FmdB family regulatory protein